MDEQRGAAGQQPPPFGSREWAQAGSQGWDAAASGPHSSSPPWGTTGPPPPWGQQPGEPTSRRPLYAVLGVMVIAGFLMVTSGAAVIFDAGVLLPAIGSFGAALEPEPYGGPYDDPAFDDPGLGLIDPYAPVPEGPLPDGTRILDEQGTSTIDGPGGPGEGRHTFTLTRSSQVRVDVIGMEGFDPVLHLIDPQGNLIARDDDGAGGTDSRLVLDLAEGVYEIQVEGYAGTEGGYRVAVMTP